MQIAVMPLSVSHAKELLDKKVTIIIAGFKRFGLRLSFDASLNELLELKKLCEEYGASLYVPFTVFIHPSEIKAAKKYLVTLAQLNVDGIYFSDLAVYQLAIEAKVKHLLIYHPETLTTNLHEALFWEKQRIKGMVIAREVTTEDAVKIALSSHFEIHLLGHGYLAMFHSRRNLITTYFGATNITKDSRKTEYHIIEEKRDESYKILEDIHGTHIFRALPMQSFTRLNELTGSIDVLIINSSFLSEQDVTKAYVDYKNVLDGIDEASFDALMKDYIGYDEGFHKKRTVYRKRAVSKK